MPETSVRQTPVQHLVEQLNPEWLPDSRLPIVLRYQGLQQEQEIMQKLGLCDLSGLSRFGLKGSSSVSWLQEQGLPVPERVYDSQSLADGGYLIRLGETEFLLESGLPDIVVPDLESRFNPQGNLLVRVERQDASFLLVGSHARDVLAQTTGVNFRDVSNGSWVYTRLAGVSCGILSELKKGCPSYQLWFDCSYAVYLWETLVEITDDLGGAVIGVQAWEPIEPL